MGANCCKNEVQKEQSPSYPNKNKERDSIIKSINPSSPTKSFTDKLNNRLNECLNEPTVENPVENLKEPLLNEPKVEEIVTLTSDEPSLLPALDPKKSTLTQNQDYDDSVYFSCASDKPSRAPSIFAMDESIKVQIPGGRKSHFVTYANEPSSHQRKENFQQIEQNQELNENQMLDLEQDELASQKETLEAIGELNEQPIFTNKQEKREEILGEDDDDDDEEFFETQSAFAENENGPEPGFEGKEESQIVEVDETNDEKLCEEENRNSTEKEILNEEDVACKEKFANEEEQEREEKKEQKEQKINEEKSEEQEKEKEKELEKIKEILLNEFPKGEKVFEEAEALHKLVVYSNLSQNGEVVIAQIQAAWNLPCDAETFITSINSFERMKEIYSHVEAFEFCEEKTFYLSYSETSEERGHDYVIRKSFRKVAEDQWCDVLKSIVSERYPENDSKTRMIIPFGGHFAFREEGKEMYSAKLHLEIVLKDRDFEKLVRLSAEKIKQFVEGYDQFLKKDAA